MPPETATPYLALPPLERVYVDKRVASGEIATHLKAALRKYPQYDNTRWIEIEDYHTLLEESRMEGLGFLEGKKTLLIYPEMGKFLHACPGSDGVLCCRYLVIDFGMNCPYDCQYCYLQTYLTSHIMTLAGNIPELLQELETTLKEQKQQGHWRIGTGEYTDSLALEPLTGIGSLLAKFFSRFENATLELKTKSAHVEGLMETKRLHHLDNTVLSWSLSPAAIAREVDKFCAPVDLRLEAARKAVDAGFQVAFHFDPMIIDGSSPEAYLELADQLMSVIPADKIRWISLGAFRYTPGLREKLRLRYPDEQVTRGEMIRAPDGKVRYLAYEREAFYHELRNRLLSYSPDLLIYLCMETQDMWRRVYGSSPRGPLMLDREFEKRRIKLMDKKGN